MTSTAKAVVLTALWVATGVTCGILAWSAQEHSALGLMALLIFATAGFASGALASDL